MEKIPDGPLLMAAPASPLREAFAIEDKPTTRAEAQRKWKEEAPVRIRLTESLGIKLD